jgi:hypothetical protein
MGGGGQQGLAGHFGMQGYTQKNEINKKKFRTDQSYFHRDKKR